MEKVFRQALKDGVDEKEVLDEVMSERRSRRWKRRQHGSWTDEELQRYHKLRDWGVVSRDIALLLFKGPKEIRAQEVKEKEEGTDADTLLQQQQALLESSKKRQNSEISK